MLGFKRQVKMTEDQFLHHILTNGNLTPTQTKVFVHEQGGEKLVEVVTKFFLKEKRAFRKVRSEFRQLSKNPILHTDGSPFACIVRFTHVTDGAKRHYASTFRTASIQFSVREFPELSPKPRFRIVSESFRWIMLDALDLNPPPLDLEAA